MSAWRRWLFALGWAIGWGLQAAGWAVAYLTAGLLTREWLRSAIPRTWDTYGREEHHILSGLMPWEQECFDRFLRPDDTILLIGSGTGRDLIALLRRGHRVHGLESAGAALEASREMLARLGLRATLQHAAIETADLPGPFDVAIFSWFCYGYIPESRARVAALERVKAALAPGGRIIISYIPLESHRRLPIRLTMLVARLTGSGWRPQDGDKVWASMVDWRFVHYQHEFEAAEMEAEARAAGLRVVSHVTAGESVCVLTA